MPIDLMVSTSHQPARKSNIAIFFTKKNTRTHTPSSDDGSGFFLTFRICWNIKIFDSKKFDGEKKLVRRNKRMDSLKIVVLKWITFLYWAHTPCVHVVNKRIWECVCVCVWACVCTNNILVPFNRTKNFCYPLT